MTDVHTNSATPVQCRSQKYVARFFEGLDLPVSGVTVGHRWWPTRPAGPKTPTDTRGSLWTGGIKP